LTADAKKLLLTPSVSLEQHFKPVGIGKNKVGEPIIDGCFAHRQAFIYFCRGNKFGCGKLQTEG
jgi:hypothetical protein